MIFTQAMLHLTIPLSFAQDLYPTLLSLEESPVSRSIYQAASSEESAEDQPLRFRYCFVPCPVSPAAQIDGSPLLAEGDGTMMKRYELAQVQRSAVGLHHRENTIYRLKASGIPFRIGKVRLWLYRNGAAFLTIEIKGEHLPGERDLTGEDVLNLSEQLCTIYKRKEITYQLKKGKGIVEDRSFTIKDMIRQILELQSYLPLEPYASETYQKAHGLFYGVTCVEEQQEFPAFLEMLRQQRKSSMRTASGVSEEYRYCPETYLSWVMGEHMLAAVADLKEGGPDNEFFLQDPGCLSHYVAENYLFVYTYCLGLHLLSKRAEKDCERIKRKSTAALQEELVQGLMRLNDYSTTDLTNVDHMNELFETYLCDGVWDLQKRLAKLDGEYLPCLIRDLPSDIFISYRRKGGFYPARLLYTLLKERHKNPFLDTECLGAGYFDEHLYEVIEKCQVILFVLTEHALEGCDKEEDWMRKEILKAQEMRRKKGTVIIPLLIDDFVFPKEMPEGIELSREQAVLFKPQSFRGDFERLCELIADSAEKH